MGVPVAKYPRYIVEDNGMVFSTFTSKYLKPSRTKHGYLTVELFNENGSRRLLVHRLVAQAYLPNPNGYPQVNHIDENKQNNRVDNLEWCTAKYNMNYGNAAQTRHLLIDYGTQERKELARQNGKSTARPIVQFKGERRVNVYENAHDAERKTGINSSHILEVARGKRKSAGGFQWSYGRRDDLSEFL